jgi:hypothetical protein
MRTNLDNNIFVAVVLMVHQILIRLDFPAKAQYFPSDQVANLKIQDGPLMILIQTRALVFCSQHTTIPCCYIQCAKLIYMILVISFSHQYFPKIIGGSTGITWHLRLDENKYQIEPT